jgi:hypothetical protein
MNMLTDNLYAWMEFFCQVMEIASNLFIVLAVIKYLGGKR